MKLKTFYIISLIAFTLFSISLISSCSTKNNQTNKDTSACQHIIVTDKAVTATCKESGLTEGSHCSICNEVFVIQNIIPKTTDHISVIDPAIPATCKNSGLTEGSHCSVCNVVLVEQKSIPKTNYHNFVLSQNYTSYNCSSCGLNVIQHGNADGSISGGNNKIKYYITGDFENRKNIEIVVYGTGEMPDFSKTDPPQWHDFLYDAVTVKIEEGITSIGKFAFYCPESITYCNFVMSNTVKIIKTGAINLNIKNLVLGNSVEIVESNAIGDINAIFIPKSVKKLYLDALGNESYFYEGTLDEFYQIEMYVYNNSISIKDYIEYIKSVDENLISNIHVYIQAKYIFDTSHYWR